MLEATASSLHQHGFKTIAFVGDSGDNQKAQQNVATQLNQRWHNDGTRVVHLGDYYSKNNQVNYLLNAGLTNSQIGTHAGIRDTSELMAVYPAGVRNDLLIDRSTAKFYEFGANGDASKANSTLGLALLNLKINAAVHQLQKLPH